MMTAHNGFASDVELFSGFDPYEVDGTNATANSEYVATTKVPTGYASVQSNIDIDFSQATAQIRLVRIPDQINTEAFFSLHFDDNKYYFFSVDSYIVMARKEDGFATLDSMSMPYMPLVHVYFRFRHDRDSNEIVFETSADGMMWIPRHRIQVKFDLRIVRMRIGAGAYTPGNTKASAGVFDDYLLCSGT